MQEKQPMQNLYEVVILFQIIDVLEWGGGIGLGWK